MAPVALRIANDVPYVMMINHESHFAWLAQYLVKFKCHFSWQARYLVKFKSKYHFSWQAQYLVKFGMMARYFSIQNACGEREE